MRHTRRHRDSYFSVIMTLLWNASGKKNKGQGLTEKFFSCLIMVFFTIDARPLFSVTAAK